MNRASAGVSPAGARRVLALGMMAHVRPLLRSIPLLALVGLSALAVPAAADEAADPETSSPGTPLEGPTRKEKVEELWLDAKGDSGFVRTVPLYLDDKPAEYRFGPAFCGRAHRLGDQTLHALQSALAHGHPVRIDAAPPSGDEGRRCITGVAFFAP